MAVICLQAREHFGVQFQVEFAPIEWHKNLHKGYELDDIFGECIMNVS